MTKRIEAPVLLASVFIIATCGILYELLIGTISTYFLGSGILHFSLTIGFFLTFMGVGSWLSRYVRSGLLGFFIGTELVLGVVGGFSSFILYFCFAYTELYYTVSFFLIAILGTLIGIEIPILLRMLRQYDNLRNTVSQVLSFDYLGALLASLVFPLVLLPYMGTMKTGFFVGLLNLAVGTFNIILFRKSLSSYKGLLGLNLALIAVLLAGFFSAGNFSRLFERHTYQDEVILSKQSAYQKIVMTKWQSDTRLFLNGSLQFSTVDEYRYHEPLVHVPMSLVHRPERVLVLGGGDGLVLRELLRYKAVGAVDLVDLDPAVTNLGKENPILKRINGNSLLDPRVTVYNQDGFNFIREGSGLYGLIILDLPDPHDPGLGKLYSREFYMMVKKRLAADGVMVTQSTSPFFAPKVFWCIHHTLEDVFPGVVPFTCYVPSFGQWGFNLATNWQAGDSLGPASSALEAEILERMPDRLPKGLRYLSLELLPTLFVFPKDIAERPTSIQQLDQQVLVQYYQDSWKSWH